MDEGRVPPTVVAHVQHRRRRVQQAAKRAFDGIGRNDRRRHAAGDDDGEQRQTE